MHLFFGIGLYLELANLFMLTILWFPYIYNHLMDGDFLKHELQEYDEYSTPDIFLSFVGLMSVSLLRIRMKLKPSKLHLNTTSTCVMFRFGLLRSLAFSIQEFRSQ